MRQMLIVPSTISARLDPAAESEARVTIAESCTHMNGQISKVNMPYSCPLLSLQKLSAKADDRIELYLQCPGHRTSEQSAEADLRYLNNKTMLNTYMWMFQYCYL